MSNLGGFYLGYYGVTVGIPMLLRIVVLVVERCKRPEPEPFVEVAIGSYNGEPMASVFLGESQTAREIREADERWWNGLTDAERAEHLAWEDEQTAIWLQWADERKAARDA